MILLGIFLINIAENIELKVQLVSKILRDQHVYTLP